MLVIVITVFVFTIVRKREHYISLEEVIPEGEIVSQEEGVVDYRGARYLLGTSDLKMKKQLLDKLDLLEIERSVMVDMRYTGQIIIKERNGS